jgi:hypothetical protein
MNDPRTSGGPVSLGNWSKPGMGSAEEVAPPEMEKPVIKCPECGAEFELKEPEEKEETPAAPEEGMVA